MRFWALSICLVAACAAAVSGIVVHYQRTHWLQSPAVLEEQARKKLAFQSLEDRIPKGKAISPSKPMSKDAENRWELFERTMEAGYSTRSTLLKALHEKTRNFFVASPAFGSARQLISDEQILFDDYHSSYDAPAQPGSPASFPASPGEMLNPINAEEDHYYYHVSSMVAFLYAPGFGYFKDVKQVAGFKPHGFRFWGEPVHPKKWQIHHILLVGVLRHEQPLVYLSDKLPSMQQLKDGKTRPLDLFEQSGLGALKDGEDLYIIQKDDTLRMLGALRATKQCLNCHHAEKGDLLGAFSYTLRLEKPAMP